MKLAESLKTATCVAMMLGSLSALAKSKMEVTINLAGSDYYNISRSTLTGDISLIKGNFTIKGNVEGESIEISQAIPSQQAPNQTKLEVLNRNSVEIIEGQYGIKGVAKAEVKKSFGKLKSISISRDSYLAVMRPVFEQSGLDLLKNLRLSDSTARLETDINITDIDCAREADQLKCDSEVSIRISVEEL